jgi:hypothetical protein
MIADASVAARLAIAADDKPTIQRDATLAFANRAKRLRDGGAGDSSW